MSLYSLLAHPRLDDPLMVVAFDAWVDAAPDARLLVTTNRGDLDLALDDIGPEDLCLDAGGLDRRLRVFRLPDGRLDRELDFTRTVDLDRPGDNPVWICVTTEDGYQAWSSPIYFFR